MKVYSSTNYPEDADTQQCIYCSMDSLCTLEIYNVIKAKRNDAYAFEQSMIAPILTMQTRGIKIDAHYKDLVLNGDPNASDKKIKLGLKARAYNLGGMTRQQMKRGGKWIVSNKDALLQDLALAVWNKTLNYHSEKQLKEFFYDALKIPKIIVSQKGKAKVTCNRDALEKIRRIYPRGAIFADIILRIRDLEKQVEVLSQRLSASGRWAASYNPAGTDTFRWSSSSNPLGHSANVQNISPELRRAFVADEGFTLFNCDQQGAEARIVAYLSGDENYINAVESGDVHTMVASMVWGFEPKRELAERIFYRNFSYRFMCKKLAHGSSYYGTPPTLAKQTTIDLELVEEFQRVFFKKFPGIRRWQNYVIRTLQRTGRLSTPFGFTRRFWGRVDDESVWRAGIAFVPQSTVGCLTARGIREIHTKYEPRAQILANGHDAVLGQIRTSEVAAMMPLVLDCLSYPLDITDIDGNTRKCLIPWDAKIGYNWGEYSKDNLDGLRKWTNTNAS